MSRDDLTIGYLGYSDVTKEILDALSLDPDLVVSFVDAVEAEYGRGVSYEEYEPWIRVESINTSRAIEALDTHNIDVLLVMGWPELLGSEALAAPNVGSLGRHLSLLPERRGRAPVAWALIHGLDRTGVSLFWLDQGVDSGPIVGQTEVEIDRDDHAQDLHEKCTRASISLLSEEVLPRFYEGEMSGEAQDHDRATYTHPRRPDMGIIDWTDSAATIHDFVRGQSHPYPGAFSYHEMTKVTAWYSRIEHETVTRAAPGTVLRIGNDPEDIVVQCGAGTVALTVEPAEGGELPTEGNRLGAIPY